MFTFSCSIFSLAATPPQIVGAIFFLFCDMCLRFRACLVLPHIELSVNARYQRTGVLLRARRLLLVSTASGSVRRTFLKYMRSE